MWAKPWCQRPWGTWGHSLGVGGREALGGHGVERKEAGLPQHLTVSLQALTTG